MLGKRKEQDAKPAATAEGFASKKAKSPQQQHPSIGADAIDTNLMSMSNEDLAKEIEKLEMIKKIQQLRAETQRAARPMVTANNSYSSDDDRMEGVEENAGEVNAPVVSKNRCVQAAKSEVIDLLESDDDEEDADLLVQDKVDDDDENEGNTEETGARNCNENSNNEMNLKDPWYSRFLKLKQYYEMFGRDVPAKHLLATWENIQRKGYRILKEGGGKSKITHTRIKLLNSIEFDWNKNNGSATDSWECRYEELMEYHEENGHCHVPARYAANPVLGRWVKQQRKNAKASKKQGSNSKGLTQERINRLDAIAFAWELQKQVPKMSWDGRYQQLLEYRREHGDCDVPTHFSENKSLGIWANIQRRNYKHFKSGANPCGGMNQSKADQLNAIGFRLKGKN